MALLLLLFVAIQLAFAGGPRILFEPNLGQTAAQARYLARTNQGVLFFTDRAMILQTRDSVAPVSFEFVNGRPSAAWETLEATGETTTYHVGRDTNHWADKVPSYARLGRRGLFAGIDAVFYGTSSGLEYDFVIAPGADPASIRLRVAGASKITVGRDGSLIVKTPAGEFRQARPRIYQTGSNGEVLRSGGFRLTGRNEIGFWLGAYDRRLPLTIDPVLDSSTYLGGRGDDRASVGSNGIVFGTTTSTDFPGALGRRGGVDAYFRSGSSTIIVGGSGDDIPTGAVYLASGSSGIVLAGYTTSKDLPTTFNALQSGFAGGETDGFLYTSGSQFTSSLSYFGSSGDDRIIGLGSNGSNVYFAGSTTGRFAFVNGTLEGPGGQQDVFYATVSFSGSIPNFFSSLRYFGGSGNDRALGISTGFGSVYVVGETESSDFPAAGTLNGPSDAFVINTSTSTSSNRGRLFGGSGADRATAVSVLNGGAIAIAGATSSTDLELVNSKQDHFGGGASDAFWVRFDPSLMGPMNIRQSSYWGGSDADEATSILLDGTNHHYLGGWTQSPDFPVVNAIQPGYGGREDGFLIHVDDALNVHQSTYFGGAGNDRVLSVTSSGNFAVTIAGETTSANLLVKLPEQAALGGGSDGFVAKITAQLITGSTRLFGSANYLSSVYLNIPANFAGEITVTVAAPAIALVGPYDGPTAESFHLPSGSAAYVAECLTNAGSTELTVSSPGVPSFTTHLDCVKPSLAISGVATTRLWSQPTNLYFYLAAYAPDDPTQGSSLTAKDSSGAVDAQITLSNPLVASASVSHIRVGDPNTTTYLSPVSITPTAIGKTDITVSAPGFETRSMGRPSRTE